MPKKDTAHEKLVIELQELRQQNAKLKQLTEEHIQIRNELGMTMARLQHTFTETVTALQVTVEKKDISIAQHQRYVAQLSKALAIAMGFTSDQIEGIEKAALLHDIGKIAIPAELLNKPQPLNKSEFELIKLHPQIGFEILNNIDFPWPVATLIQQHHEKINGTGYPQGLVGDAILPEAKIIAVAEVVSEIAMNSTFHPARGLEPAFNEIYQNKGTCYDPEVVFHCMDLFAQKHFQFV
jgi:putative nucleotidyltransferase with HDIG domain